MTRRWVFAAAMLTMTCASVQAQLRPGAFTTVTITDTSATALKVGCAVGAAGPCTGTVVAGAVSVAGIPIINSSGQIPAITSTYFTSLAFNAANLTGTIASGTQDLITRTGTITSGIWNAGAVTSSGAITSVSSLVANHPTQAEIYLTKTNATAQSWKWYNDGTTVGLYDITNARQPLGFTIATGNAIFSGLLTVNGFGTHPFSAGGTGVNRVGIRNTTAGTGNYSDLIIGNDTQNDTTTLRTHSSTYTPGVAGYDTADGTLFRNNTAGGITIAASHASGAIRVFAGGTGEDVRIHASGGVSVGDTTDPGATNFRVAGTSTLIGALTAPTLDTGQGANELYDMDQNVLTTSSPTFANMTSGTYTPTITNGVNVASATALVCLYIRVGDNVIVHGVVTVDPTLGGTDPTSIGISLPFASNLAATTDLSGLITGKDGAGPEAGQAVGDTANDRALAVWDAMRADSHQMAFTFQYRIL